MIHLIVINNCLYVSTINTFTLDMLTLYLTRYHARSSVGQSRTPAKTTAHAQRISELVRIVVNVVDLKYKTNESVISLLIIVSFYTCTLREWAWRHTDAAVHRRLPFGRKRPLA
jgi:hypothetical protein